MTATERKELSLKLTAQAGKSAHNTDSGKDDKAFLILEEELPPAEQQFLTEEAWDNILKVIEEKGGEYKPRGVIEDSAADIFDVPLLLAVKTEPADIRGTDAEDEKAMKEWDEAEDAKAK